MNEVNRWVSAAELQRMTIEQVSDMEKLKQAYLKSPSGCAAQPDSGVGSIALPLNKFPQ